MPTACFHGRRQAEPGLRRMFRSLQTVRCPDEFGKFPHLLLEVEGAEVSLLFTNGTGDPHLVDIFHSLLGVARPLSLADIVERMVINSALGWAEVVCHGPSDSVLQQVMRNVILDLAALGQPGKASHRKFLQQTLLRPIDAVPGMRPVTVDDNCDIPVQISQSDEVIDLVVGAQMTEQAAAVEHDRKMQGLLEFGSDMLQPVFEVNPIGWAFDPDDGVGLQQVRGPMTQIFADLEALLFGYGAAYACRALFLPDSVDGGILLIEKGR